ncbi:MAG: serine/threonine protein kinase, partial [Deltaproteobacteria bacterium]|nr:serine/threonine protein kinase [Deltaproteobacteria bacterium]
MLHLDPDARPPSLDAARPELVAALRRLAPSYGSSSLSWLLAERCAPQVSLLADLTAAVTREAKTSHDGLTATTTTMTYSNAAEVDRPEIEPVALELGDRIPGTRYRLVNKLGSGGSAEVFRAQHIDLDRQVAIKILDHDLARQSSAIAQFRMEARACSRIGHPNIVDVVDFGELDDGRFFFAMELVEGESLAEVLARERRIPAERVIAIFRQVTQALAVAHEHHIIHRDMKPENIMLTTSKEGRSDWVKVLDFGVMAFASDTAAECVGTPGYMAPEQVQGALPTPQMDIYALGATIYECLSGTLPYPGVTLGEYAAQQAVGPAIALRQLPSTRELHPAIERVVHRALERSPEARQASCADLEADLIVAQGDAGIHTAWDDLPLPSGMLDTRRGELRSPGARAADETTGETDLSRVSRGGGARSRSPMTVAAGGIFILALVSLIVALALWPTGKSPSKKGKSPNAMARSSGQIPSSAGVRKGALPAALAALLVQAKEAAAQGHFSQPRGKSAYDRILAIEAAR